MAVQSIAPTKGNRSHMKVGPAGAVTLIVGLTFLLSLTVVVLGYYQIRQRLLESIQNSNVIASQSLAKVADASAPSLTTEQRIRQIENIWATTNNQFVSSYVCIVDSDGNLASHTGEESTVGNYVGDNELLDKTKRLSNLSGLVQLKQDWVGWYISSEGEKQFAAFSYCPTLSSLVAVQVPKTAIDEKVYRELLPLVIALVLILLVLLPIALTTIDRAYARAYTDLQMELSNLARAQEIGHVGNWEYRISDGAITWSDELYRIFGMDPQVVKISYAELMNRIHPDDRAKHDRYFEHMQALKPGERLENLEYRLIRPNGEERSVSVEFEVRFDDREEISSFFGVVLDTTEREKSRESLRLSEARYADLYDNAPDMYFNIDAKSGLILSCNNTFCEVLGYAKGEVCGNSVYDFYAQECHEAARIAFHTWSTMGRVQGVELRVNCKDGSQIDVSLSATAVVDEEGNTLSSRSIWRDITKQKKTIDALRVAEEKFSLAFHSSPAGLTITRIADGKFLDVNDSFLKMFEFERDEVIGYTSIELKMLTNEERDTLIREQLEAGGLIESELSARTKSGRPLVILFSSNEIQLQGNACHITTIVDITDRKTVEFTLSKSERKYRTLIEAIPQKIFTKDINSAYLSCNELYAGDLGIEADEIVGTADFDYYPKELAEKYRADDQEIIRTGQSRSFEEPYRQGDKETWVYTMKSPIIDDDGTIAGVIGVFSDITRRKEAERERLEAETRYRTLFENMNAGFVLFEVIQDSEGLPVDLIVVAANEEFESTTGLNREDAVGNRLIKILPGIEDDPADWIGTYGKVAITGNSIEFEEHSKLLERYYSVVAYQAGPKQCAVVFVDNTERVKSVTELRNSDERLNLSLEFARMATFDWDIRTNTMNWSKNLEPILGFPAGQFNATYEAFRELIHPVDLPNVSVEIDRAIANKRSFKSEFRIVWPDKSIHWVSSQGYFSRGDSGESHRIIGIVREFTEEKNRDLEVVRSRELLEETQRLTHLGGWEVDVVSRQMTWSNEMYQVIGMDTRNEPLSIDESLNLVYPTDREKASRFLDSIIADGHQRREEFRIVRPDGAVRWVEANGRGETSDDDTVTQIVGSLQDINDAKLQAERQELLESAVTASVDAIIITDLDGCIDWVNPGFELQSGYSLKEVAGVTPRLLKSGKESTEFYTDLWNTIRSGQAWHGTIVNRRKSGDVYTVESSITPVKNSTGTVTHFVAIQKDITERQHMEQQVRQSQKLEAIGTLAGGIAHDFNNILSAIMGYGELALSELDTDTQLHEDVSRILTAGNRAKELVRQILTFSRQAESIDAQIQPYLVVNEATHLLQSTLPSTVELQTSVEKSENVVICDATRIHQIVLNLCTNAFHALPNEKGSIKVECGVRNVSSKIIGATNTAPPGAYVVISVEDNGNGMTQETISRVFEPFFTTKPQGRGTGLGLSTVRGIVEQCGGTIRVESKIGKGTLFEVYLPCIEISEPIKDAETARPLTAVAGEQILVVDDEQNVRELHCRMLEDLGYRVKTVASPEVALTLFFTEPQQFDLVISDQTMPGMTGTDLASEILKIRADVPIIICSGRHFSLEGLSLDNATRILQLEKPVSIQELATAVRAMLDSDPETKNA